MSKLEETKTKLIPRNAPALRKLGTKNPTPHLVAGNPISTRLESGIGNCFPGLECDLRNLERRFFPFLEMDMPDNRINLFKVDIAGAQAARAAGKITQATLKAYRTLNAEGLWTVEIMAGTFGPLGRQTLTIADLPNTSTGAHRRPVDPWTAVRLLAEGTDVRLVLRRMPTKANSKSVTVTAKRARYLGDDGALAEMFLPGELTQSLCSPWTHDFRDCACFYWASNHPDIAMPPLPSAPAADPKWDIEVPWERSNRTVDKLPAPAKFTDPFPVELKYFEINRRWQSLNFVIERREQIGPYAQRVFTGKPLADKTELETHLRYAAGVELAVLQEYLAAAYSLKPERVLTGPIRDNVSAAHAEIMRIAIGEMRHLRAVNDVLASLLGRPNYKPALGVATKIPGKKPGQNVPVKPRPLSHRALDSFIEIEAPSESVDGVYARILATLNQRNNAEDIQAIRTVMTEGENHYRTFRMIKEWLAPYKEKEYLRAAKMHPPPHGIVENQTLQRRYATLLKFLYDGYKAGMPEGASDLNNARNLMIGNSQDKVAQSGGINAAAEAVANRGYLVVFKPPPGPQFAAVDPP
jgi:Ferritin-like